MKVQNVSPYEVILLCESHHGKVSPQEIVEVTQKEYDDMDKAVFSIVKTETKPKGDK